ncbi:MAG: OmpA family protein, partial [Bacteroidota bacterium]|nr:OmpA family protein [Bacteroidota bacterium]
ISIKKLPFGNPDSSSVMHPAVNNEGTLLVCSSDRANGQGGYDLYYSQRKAVSQPWSALKAFGNNINTPGNEVFPSITQNGYLYYSSDWMPGLGGLDIFRIPVKDAIVGKGTPEHLSYPINSSADDFGWCQQDSSGTKGYFTSDRLNNDDNLYSFSYEPVLTVKIPRKSYLEGSVLERQSKRPIKGATVFLYNLKEDSVYVAKTDAKGKYHFPVLNTSKVIIKAVDKAYVKDCFAGNITYVQQPKNTIQKAFRDLLLYNFKIGFTWKLSNIHFDPDKWCIRTDAKPALDSLVSVLKEQPVIVEIGSHTDSRGSSKSNERLSQHRAESVVNYLIQQGVDPARITAKGYGESRLLNKCADGVPCSEEEHQVNNRTEVKIMGYTDLRNEPKSIDPDIFSDGDKIDKNLFPKGYFNDCK